MTGPQVLPKLHLPVHGDVKIDVYSDLHVGARGFLSDLFQEDLKRTLEDENRFAFFNGDLFNAAMRDAKHGGVYEEVMNLDEALDWLDERLTPLAFAGKLLGFTDGNHDKYAWHRTGISPVKQLVSRLRVADRYLQDGGWLWTSHGTAKGSRATDGSVRPIEYLGWYSHGTGNSAASSSVEKVTARFRADYYAFGHTHTPLVLSGRRYGVYPQNGSVQVDNWLAGVGGSYLAYDGYALEKTLAPRANGKLTITLSDHHKDVDMRIPR